MDAEQGQAMLTKLEAELGRLDKRLELDCRSVESACGGGPGRMMAMPHAMQRCASAASTLGIGLAQRRRLCGTRNALKRRMDRQEAHGGS